MKNNAFRLDWEKRTLTCPWWFSKKNRLVPGVLPWWKAKFRTRKGQKSKGKYREWLVCTTYATLIRPSLPCKSSFNQKKQHAWRTGPHLHSSSVYYCFFLILVGFGKFKLQTWNDGVPKLSNCCPSMGRKQKQNRIGNLEIFHVVQEEFF